jgi:hypothetical protein
VPHDRHQRTPLPSNAVVDDRSRACRLHVLRAKYTRIVSMMNLARSIGAVPYLSISPIRSSTGLACEF